MSAHADFIAKLRDMRKLLEKPEAWTQGCMAKTGGGKDAGPRDPDAVCWCLVGAAYRAGLSCWYFSSALNMSTWNDKPERTHAEILACIDNSIAALEAK